ncbi:MAG: Bacteriocin-processing peptidase [Chthonomonadaceae bacterium]|nr:Bacteriocin-processing peptidase [Chthonomonadaceae bacterium]
MFSKLPPITATSSCTPKLPDACRLWHRFPLLIAGLALGLSGCHSRPTATATPVTPTRALTGPSAAIGQVQSSVLYRQAREDCKQHDYQHAASLLDALSKTPGISPEAVTFVEQQRAICLKDAGLPTAVPTIASLPAHAPADADCGPRALLLVCQTLGVKTNVETLRKMAGTTAKGTTLAGLEQAAQKLGLQAEGVQVSREALPEVSPPAIAWDRRQHFIVLQTLTSSGDGGTATIHDPNRSGAETISQESLLQRCGGVLLLLHR